jgi:hypothetical protein
MRTSTISPRALLGGLMLFTSGLSYAACSSDGGATTSTGNQPVTASASGSGGGSGASTTAGGTGGTSGSTTSSSAGGTGGAGGCFPGTPTTNDQFLNSCNGQTCQHYDNSQLTKLSTDGGLPPLP